MHFGDTSGCNFENQHLCTSSFLVKKCAKMLKYGCGETIKTVLLETKRQKHSGDCCVVL